MPSLSSAQSNFTKHLPSLFLLSVKISTKFSGFGKSSSEAVISQTSADGSAKNTMGN